MNEKNIAQKYGSWCRWRVKSILQKQQNAGPVVTGVYEIYETRSGKCLPAMTIRGRGKRLFNIGYNRSKKSIDTFFPITQIQPKKIYIIRDVLTQDVSESTSMETGRVEQLSMRREFAIE